MAVRSHQAHFLTISFVGNNEPDFRNVADLIVVILGVLPQLHAGSYGPFTLQDFQAKGAFELVVNEAKYLKSGTSKLTTESAYVTLAHGLIPENSDGLEIVFFPKPITERIKHRHTGE
jgi:hypothetical protein